MIPSRLLCVWSSYQKKLAVRAGVSIALWSMILSVLLSYLFFHRIYNTELSGADTRIEQLVQTVEHSVAIAVYLENEELAQEISLGLVRNDIVSALIIISERGMRISSDKPILEFKSGDRSFPLMSPFLVTEQVGTIVIRPNQILIEEAARKVAMFNVFLMSFFSLMLVTLVIFLTHYQLTQPLNNLAKRLHEINPGSSERVESIRDHSKDEIGQLGNDINYLLHSVQVTLDTERLLRKKIEMLEKQFRLIFEKASGGIVLTDRHGKIQMFNPSFVRLVGADEEQENRDFHEKNLSDFFLDPESIQEALIKSIDNPGLALDIKLREVKGSGLRWLHGLFSPVSDENDQILIECIMYDVSERAQREMQTRVDAEHDPLTGLLNRRACEHYVQKILHLAELEDYTVGIFLIDLDRFKPINDTLGHEAGDSILKEVSIRLRNCVRNEDLVVRWGGDEFVIVATEKNSELDMNLTAQRILDRLEKEIDVGSEQHVTIGASIGVALFPDHSQDFLELVKLADGAMYQAKTQGRNGYILHLPDNTTDHQSS